VVIAVRQDNPSGRAVVGYKVYCRLIFLETEYEADLIAFGRGRFGPKAIVPVAIRSAISRCLSLKPPIRAMGPFL
jgi:hypothetical protein